MYLEVTEQPLDPWQAIAAYQKRAGLCPGTYGATAVFVGTTRDNGESPVVQSMKLEHYPGMTERHLRLIVEQAYARWPLQDALIIHRVGDLLPGDPIVVVSTWAQHRTAALQACQFLIDELKHRAPFWKLELSDNGAHWVESNTPGAPRASEPE